LENAKDKGEGEGEREGEEQATLRNDNVWLAVETTEAGGERELLSTDG
jgi:hypothetical protein